MFLKYSFLLTFYLISVLYVPTDFIQLGKRYYLFSFTFNSEFQTSLLWINPDVLPLLGFTVRSFS